MGPSLAHGNAAFRSSFPCPPLARPSAPGVAGRPGVAYNRPMSDADSALPRPRVRHPLVLVLTGPGKGKTTSAFGQVLRAWGRGWRCLVVQFIKAGRPYGEVTAARRLPGVEVHSLGLGFVGAPGGGPDREEHRRAAREALSFCRERTADGSWDLLVMDEVNVALSEGLLAREEMLGFLDDRPAGLTVVLTGRGAPPWLREAADLVSDIRDEKHPFDKGVPAQKGIEY